MKINVPNNIPERKAALLAGNRLNPDVRRNLVRVLVNEMRSYTDNASKKQMEIVAHRLTSLYADSLKDNIENMVIGTSYDSLMKQLISRNENLNRNSTSPIVNVLTKRNATPPVKKSTTNIDSYGCVNWSPEVSEEDHVEMSSIKQELNDMHETVPIQWEKGSGTDEDVVPTAKTN